MTIIAAIYALQIVALLVAMVAQFRVRRRVLPIWSWVTINIVMLLLIVRTVEAVLDLYEYGIMQPIVESGFSFGITAALLYRTYLIYNYRKRREQFIAQLEHDFEEYRSTWPDQHSTQRPA